MSEHRDKALNLLDAGRNQEAIVHATIYLGDMQAEATKWDKEKWERT